MANTSANPSIPGQLSITARPQVEGDGRHFLFVAELAPDLQEARKIAFVRWAIAAARLGNSPDGRFLTIQVFG